MPGGRCIDVWTEPGQFRVVLFELGGSGLSKTVQMAVLLLCCVQRCLQVSLSQPIA